MGAPSGQCATVQRVLQDDRIVARVDSFCKEDGVKGEVIIDIQPANVVVVPPLPVDMLHGGGGNKKRMVTSDIITFRENAEIRIKFL